MASISALRQVSGRWLAGRLPHGIQSAVGSGAAWGTARGFSTGFSTGDVRTDWTREEVKSIYEMPFLELIHRAAGVHRAHNDPSMVQYVI